MLARELKSNLKTFIIFLGILVAMLIIVFLVYPSIMTANGDIDKLLDMFPKELLKSFNMDIISLESVFGWLATEGYVFIALIGGTYFGILGGTIILKEQSDHTIDFLYSKPISKSKIVTSKVICGLIYLIVFNVIVALTNLFGLNYNNDLDISNWLLFSGVQTILELVIFCVSLLCSLCLKKTSQGISISIGLIFAMYMFNILSILSDKLETFKYLSVFYYMDTRQIIESNCIETNNLLITLGLSTLFIILTYVVYQRKELGK